MKNLRFPIWLFLVLLILSLPVTALAQGAPSYPAVYGGTAVIDGDPVQEGTIITARINGVRVAQGVISNGNWSLFIAEPPGKIYRQRVVHFVIGDTMAGESANWSPNGGVIDLTGWSRTQAPAVAFSSLIERNNLLRVWHFDARAQHVPPYYGWSLYDTRAVFSRSNTLELIRPGEFYFMLVERSRQNVRVGDSVIDVYQGWNPIEWR